MQARRKLRCQSAMLHIAALVAFSGTEWQRLGVVASDSTEILK